MMNAGLAVSFDAEETFKRILPLVPSKVREVLEEAATSEEFQFLQTPEEIQIFHPELGGKLFSHAAELAKAVALVTEVKQLAFVASKMGVKVEYPLSACIERY